MKKITALITLLLAGEAHAEDAQLFTVNTSARVTYPDGTKVSLQKDKVLTIEGFECVVETGLPPGGTPYFWGPTISCGAPGVGIVATVARCDMTAPGHTNSATLQLHSSRAEANELYTQVTIGCETTYTRLPKQAPTKKKASAVSEPGF